METYGAKLPEGFYDPISCPVTTMATKRKQIKLHEDDVPTFDTELIFTRTLGFMDREDFNMKELFDYELSQIPTSLFTNNGISKSQNLRNFWKLNNLLKRHQTPK